VAQLISDIIKKNDHALRRNLLDFLKISPAANNLIGKLFEVHCIREMSRKFEGKVRPLDVDQSGFTLTLTEGAFKQTAVNTESIDGYFEDGHRIYFFQMTVSDSHPVKVRGLKNALQELGKLDSIETLDMRLIFVVPESQIDFKKQQITLPDLTSGMKSNVTQIQGIGARRAGKLAAKKIYTVESYVKAVNDIINERSRSTKGLDELVWNRENESKLRLLENIHQYLLVMKGSEW
jgi:hypothetical protein